jgi:predicted lipid-binding transport protein (Tim44 family)
MQRAMLCKVHNGTRHTLYHFFAKLFENPWTCDYMAFGRVWTYNLMSLRSVCKISPDTGGGDVNYEIIILAMVAAFLGLRLYSVLGKREGHEQEPMMRQPLEERQPPAIRPPSTITDLQSGSAPALGLDIEPAAEAGLRAIINADRQFDAGLFIEGAKSAYKLTLEAFWKGDRKAIDFLCDDDVTDSFIEVIAERENRGEVCENRLIRIDKAQIIGASYDHPMARITLQFDADVATMTKDKEGNVIGGLMSDAEETHDIWTFVRDIKGNDRNWKLDETDEA